MTAASAQREDGKRKIDATLSAFDGEGFDAKKTPLSSAPGKTPHEAIERDATFLGQLIPLLTPEQRAGSPSGGSDTWGRCGIRCAAARCRASHPHAGGRSALRTTTPLTQGALSPRPPFHIPPRREL